jgi:hypothetical protein
MLVCRTRLNDANYLDCIEDSSRPINAEDEDVLGMRASDEDVAGNNDDGVGGATGAGGGESLKKSGTALIS